VTRVAAIVPARNEQARIADTVTALRLIDTIDEVVVVDDGSDDDTAERAERAGASVIRVPANRGKGAALRTGVASTDADVLCFIDGDLGGSASLASALIAPVLRSDADMTIAAPPPSGPSGFGLVERTARWGIRLLTKTDMRRPLSGPLLERCVIADRFGVETALTIDALRAGFRVVEVEAFVEHARTGRDAAGFAHRARQGFDVARVLAVRVLNRGR
jgi:glycosyltransferase involved in cell wall biosynthesis